MLIRVVPIPSCPYNCEATLVDNPAAKSLELIINESINDIIELAKAPMDIGIAIVNIFFIIVVLVSLLQPAPGHRLRPGHHRQLGPTHPPAIDVRRRDADRRAIVGVQVDAQCHFVRSGFFISNVSPATCSNSDRFTWLVVWLP